MKNLKQSRLRSALQRQNHSLSIPGIVRQMLLLNVSTGMNIVLYRYGLREQRIYSNGRL